MVALSILNYAINKLQKYILLILGNFYLKYLNIYLIVIGSSYYLNNYPINFSNNTV